MNGLLNAGNLLGRILIGGFYLYIGIMHTVDFGTFEQSVASLFGPLSMVMSIIALVALYVCSLMLLVGFKARWGALVLVIYMLVAMVVAIKFGIMGTSNWMTSMQLANHLALIGSLLMIAGQGSGAYSLKA